MLTPPNSVAHREDYHRVLLNAAIELGAEIELNASVKEIDFESTTVILESGKEILGDVILGADGEFVQMIT